MTDKTKKSLKERSKLTKIFCKSGQRKTDQDLTYCTNNYIISNHVMDVTVFEVQLIFGTSSSSTSSSSLGLE